MDFQNLQELFYNELYKNISGVGEKEYQNAVINTNVEQCLISKEELTKNFMTLECGHKFNYEPLLNEVFQQKWRRHPNEVVKLNGREIKCPYCRNVQTGILPKIDGYEALRYVNYPKKYVMKFNKCKYVTKTGKNKGRMCHASCTFDYCDRCISLVKKANERKNTKTSKEKKYNHHNNCKNTCCAILQSGKKKGSICGNPAKYENNIGVKNTEYYCGRHKTFQKTK